MPSAATSPPPSPLAPQPTPQDPQAGPDWPLADDFPCSVAQERFWLLDRLDPGNASYNVAVRWRLEGAVSTARLEQAWLRIIERHEVLRTVFPEVGGVPRQQVLPRAAFRLIEIDLRALPEAERAAEADRIGLIEARAPFDLGSGPLLRVSLLRQSDSLSLILVTTHQIVADGWSIGVMAREMGEHYRALASSDHDALDPLPIQYADYALWQLEWLRARGTEAEDRYWTRQLAGIRPFSVLPDHPRPAVPTTLGAIVSIVLPRALTDRAQQLSAEHAATLFATALSALCTMLHRYTGETEIVLGTQVSDRDQVELEGMVGQFVNSLILRNDLSGDPAFATLIERSRDIGNAALEHRHIPIERLLGMVKTSREGAHSALISVNFIFQRSFIENADYGDFRVIDLPSLPAGAIYDLNFFMVERPDGWRFSCQYNTDQFEAETVTGMLQRVQRLLASAVRDAGQPLSALALLDDDERRALLDAVPLEPAAEASDSIVADFEAAAARAPQALAVHFGEQRLTYAALDAEANRLAQALLARGLAAGERVGLALSRSLALPIALLAIAKAGGSFVLFDPDEASQRLSAKLARAGLRLLLIEGGSLAATLVSVPVLDLRAAAPELARHSSQAPMPRPDVDREVCLVFIASSDEAPGALRLSHRALALRLRSLGEVPGVRAQDRLLAVSPLALDIALMELLLPLVTGATLVLPEPRELADEARLLALLQRARISVLHALPSAWRRLIAAGWDGQPRLRAWCTADLVERRLASELLARSHDVWTLLPCAEAAFCAAAQTLRAESAQRVGTALAHTSLHVLDAHAGLLPVGAVGELWIGGACLALGPLEDDEARRAVFVTDAISPQRTSRRFRSGERARLRRNGGIERLPRADRRVLIDAHRIDLDTIEALLHRHPGVGEAALMSTRTGDGGLSLEAFLTAQVPGQSELLVETLQARLAQALPLPAHPARIVVLDALPHAADGSIDRTMLRQLVAGARTASSASAAPLGIIETELHRLWCELLGREDIDAHSNFFELGGHSLLAARMLGRIELRHGRRVSLAALFRAPSLRGLATLLTRADQRDFDFRQVVKLQAVGTRTPIIGINNTGIYYLLAKQLGPEQPFTSLQLFDPALKNAVLPQTLSEVAAAYVQLIRRVQPVGPYALMGWCVAGSLALEVACQLDEAGAGLSQLYLMDAWVPNYLRRLPWLRSVIADHTLRWHFILDDWRKMREGRQTLAEFLGNRAFMQTLQRWFARRLASASAEAEQREVSPEDYDQWLLHYLQRLSNAHTPRRYRGRITLFRSRREPTGLWFDPEAGWGPFAAGGVELHLVQGDHFTMFQEPGVSEMAERITRLAQTRLQPGPDAPAPTI